MLSSSWADLRLYFETNKISRSEKVSLLLISKFCLLMEGMWEQEYPPALLLTHIMKQLRHEMNTQMDLTLISLPHSL